MNAEEIVGQSHIIVLMQYISAMKEPEATWYFWEPNIIADVTKTDKD